jgi:hypothetical protein
MHLQAVLCHKCDLSTLYIHGNQVSDSIKNEGIPMSTTYNLFNNQGTLKQEVTQRPEWLDEQLYPFQSRFVEIDGNRIHYIDEGSGPIFPRHRSIAMPGCHHFPQVYDAPGVATAIRR